MNYFTGSTLAGPDLYCAKAGQSDYVPLNYSAITIGFARDPGSAKSAFEIAVA
jgi:hypothetical protein